MGWARGAGWHPDKRPTSIWLEKFYQKLAARKAWRELKRLQNKHNKGKQFPERDGELDTGRPIGKRKR